SSSSVWSPGAPSPACCPSWSPPGSFSSGTCCRCATAPARAGEAYPQGRRGGVGPGGVGGRRGVPDVNAPTPFGVPRPVGPSQPVPAVHIGAPHAPLVPDVTSNRLPAAPYGYFAG